MGSIKAKRQDHLQGGRGQKDIQKVFIGFLFYWEARKNDYRSAGSTRLENVCLKQLPNPGKSGATGWQPSESWFRINISG
ncbi:MAG: hypothetical protein D6715_07345 [Calditrichaeota bacterium]|nr:MAG: hypothetical protein D6715_07345 [Calditrichota bacterium]